ncbi:MAG: division/cell wall cluster transcriptional repressor MraZ [Candidatus Levybacteria bacterium]|nr:division/cell wall cluster transcriptional repressor MraZ [Candidatus Levybacteria bacterium]MBI2420485.1 division/cell wall cluster transcriptional repressor MraZ [Candidatus Levybacteria bacterium]
MLIGQESSKLDEKNRIIFPKKFRKALGDHLIVTQGFEGSLIIVALDRWSSLLEGTEGKPFTEKATRETQRFLLGTATEVELDQKGRFIIPEHLKEYAGITTEVVCLGISRYVELWDKKRWEEHSSALIKDIEPITAKLSEGE